MKRNIFDFDDDNAKVPAYLRAIKAHKSIRGFIGLVVILTMISGFYTYGFLFGLLYILGGAIFWWIINLLLNLIFMPIIDGLLKQYSNKKDI